MGNIHNIYLVSDSTGETLDRIFLALQAQFSDFNYRSHQYAFTRTTNQIEKIIDICKEKENPVILYTIVNTQLSEFLIKITKKEKIPCFGVLNDLILNFSKLLNQEASHIPSGQHAIDEEYNKRIEAIQFTVDHDDGKLENDIDKSDIVLLGVSRTSKTPTSIYLANRGYKTSNVPIIGPKSIPKKLIDNPKISCVIGLIAEPSRLLDVRKNRMTSMNESRPSEYIDIEKIEMELNFSKNLFKKYKWPIIDVTRKSVEETAASIIKIYDIVNSQ